MIINEKILEFRKLHDNNIISVVNKYVPEEFWDALDEIERLWNGWKPIQTAPKDNKRLLLLATFYNGEMTDIDFDGTWDYETDGWENGDNRSYLWFSGKGIKNPTHWMYQPDVPKVEQINDVSPQK